MFRNKNKNNSLKTLLLNSQGIRWSQPKILSLLSQLITLNVAIIIIASMSISMGERSLQDDWAKQRYSELQTIGNLSAERANFLKFRTLTIARSEILEQFLDNPTPSKRQQLITQWNSLTRNVPELLNVALYDPEGRLRFASSDNYFDIELPEHILSPDRAFGGNDIYSSDLSFAPIDGVIEPYIYQLAWLENPDHSIRGHFITVNSVLRLLDSIKPAFFDESSPLLLFDPGGYLFAGANQNRPLPGMPNSIGVSLSQTYPELWEEMNTEKFGRFHGDEATFVYLKSEMITQDNRKRDYFTLSYIRHDDISDNFFKLRMVAIFIALLIAALTSIIVYHRHKTSLDEVAKDNSMRLAYGLFNSAKSSLLVTEKGRIIRANETAYIQFDLPTESLVDRTLQLIFNLTNEQFDLIKQTVSRHNSWNGVLTLNGENKASFNAYIKLDPALQTSQERNYWIITFDDITPLIDSINQATQYQLMSDAAVAIALTDADGEIVKANTRFKQLMKLDNIEHQSILPLLGHTITSQWNNIANVLPAQGVWTAQLTPFSNASFEHSLKISVNGQLSLEGDVEYLIITLEETSATLSQSANKRAQQSNNFVIRMSDFEARFHSLSESSRSSTSLMLLDISPSGIYSHMGSTEQLEKHHKEVELVLLMDLPENCQIISWQLGKVLIFISDTNPTQSHQYAMEINESLSDKSLAEGINIGIAGYLETQELEDYLAKSEVALKRAKQSGDHNICQAFTRPYNLDAAPD
ncbi:PAS domain-containing protein [Shewanella maritima]|uniref:PAS domain-containing protein n=1 Tax=Shewanella maritima TaxID=2520507 RepID=UPI0037355F15